MHDKPVVIAVVVTYNKPELLLECLAALLAQTYVVKKIIVVDNANNKTNSDIVLRFRGNSIDYYPMKENLGGAGGFSKGLERAHNEYLGDFYWILDDDTIPQNDTLEQLLKGLDKIRRTSEVLGEKVGFLASQVNWTDGKPALMNIPKVSTNWTSEISKGLIEISSASFVSLLVSNNALEKAGLPISEFFIWGDDVEYTTRISRSFEGYLVPSSIVCHKMNANTKVDLLNEMDVQRISRYFFEIRNRMFISRESIGRCDWIKLFIKNVWLIIRVLPQKMGFKKAGVILRGLVASLGFNPKIRYVCANKD